MKKIFYCIFAALAMMACSDTDMSFLSSSQTSQMKSSYNAVSALNKTLRFFQKNEDKLMYMKVRGYRWSDLKYGIARKFTASNGNLILEVPIIPGRISSSRISDIVEGQFVRSSVLIEYDNKGNRVRMNFYEQTPTEDYYPQHANELYFSEFCGDTRYYSVDNNVLSIVEEERAMTRSLEDTVIWIDSVVITPDNGTGGEPVTEPEYPEIPDNPDGDTTIVGYCEVCGSVLQYDDATSRYYCPVCGSGAQDNGGGDGSGNSGGGGGNSSTEPSSSTYVANVAIAYIRNHAYPAYNKATCGRCARAVRLALTEGGINTDEHPLYAKDYGPYLLQWGFEEVSQENYVPQAGDIRVFQPIVGRNSIAGHIDMYDGNTWYSDYKEKDYPGPLYAKASYKIYRKK